MNELLRLQAALSTADEEKNYFTGQTSRGHAAPSPPSHAAGVYRVVDGELYLIVPGAPPIIFGGHHHARADRGAAAGADPRVSEAVGRVLYDDAALLGHGRRARAVRRA